MKRIRNILLGRPVCFCFFVLALVIGLVLPFCWGNNPGDKYGTLSLLCENHIPWFWLWACLTGGCFALNLERLFHTHDCSKKFLHALVIAMLAGLVLTSATLNHSIEDLNPKRVLHWVGAILYAGSLLAAIALFLLLKARRNRRFLPFLIFDVLIGVMVLVWLLCIGRSGYMEMIPIALLECMLAVMNFTPALGGTA